MNTENNTSKTELIELVHDKNNKHRPPIGVVLATVVKVDGKGPMISIGWSRSHSKLDTFDKEKGIQIARNRAVNPLTPSGTRNGCVPNYVDVRMVHMRERARRYFKEIPFIFE